jgi:hypothetical protein
MTGWWFQSFSIFPPVDMVFLNVAQKWGTPSITVGFPHNLETNGCPPNGHCHIDSWRFPKSSSRHGYFASRFTHGDEAVKSALGKPDQYITVALMKAPGVWK